tara:strand:- start:344 stop:670 length:327 start_codon:yes stop_codon:yes gene_type:complete
MKIIKKNRKFKVGKGNIQLIDKAHIYLKKNEMVTFKNKKMQYDVVRKSWGYYATPSINSRLLKFNFKTCIVINKISKNIFILLVDKNKKQDFKKYLKSEDCKIVKWLS